jgi:hypothetical protein
MSAITDVIKQFICLRMYINSTFREMLAVTLCHVKNLHIKINEIGILPVVLRV